MDTQPGIEKSDRLLSIDALRGFDMFWIVGGDELGKAIGRWSNSRAGRVIQEQLEHVEWEGFRFYDLIFPLFLFLVGVVLPFSLGKKRGQGRGATYWRVARRTAVLFASVCSITISSGSIGRTFASWACCNGSRSVTASRR